ncbi:MAG TPA: helix-turn-helix transcriptional regulator [Tepidisphaeraceae bacterium]|nr:helix-turn-helix transcriptional regulator [Tepidisphaeraceae bacterium]
MTARTRKQLSPRKVKVLHELARRIDTKESNRIRAQGRTLFKRHASLRTIVGALKQQRLHLGLSLSDIARRTGIAKPNLSRLENSEHAAPTLDTLERYARAVGMTVKTELVTADA